MLNHGAVRFINIILRGLPRKTTHSSYIPLAQIFILTWTILTAEGDGKCGLCMGWTQWRDGGDIIRKNRVDRYWGRRKRVSAIESIALKSRGL